VVVLVVPVMLAAAAVAVVAAAEPEMGSTRGVDVAATNEADSEEATVVEVVEAGAAAVLDWARGAYYS
jgi:hypothetical protein